MPSHQLDAIKQLIDAGENQRAQSELLEILQADPANLPAWELLAGLLDDADKQADCYRQILRVDPQHTQAAAKLAALTGKAQTLSSQEATGTEKTPNLLCQQCGGMMEIRLVGRLRDKRAICPYCGSQVDLPDTYQRVERQREEERRPWHRRSVDTVTVETRSEPGAQDPPYPLEPEIEALLARLREQGLAGLDDETIQKLKALGIEPSTDIISHTRVQVVTEDQGWLADLLHKLGVDRWGDINIIHRQSPDGVEDTRLQAGQLSADDIVRMAGESLPPKERRKCPECGAVVSHRAAKCAWCGATLFKTDDT
jgi:hypothetical protein